MSIRPKRFSIATLVKHVVLLAYAVACFYPFFWMVGTSLKSQTDALGNLASPIPEDGIHFENYAEVWEKLDFAKYFVNSISLSVVCVLCVVVIYSMVGFALARINFRGKNIVFATYVALILVPGLTVQIPLYINMVNLNLDNTFIGLLLPIVNGAGPFAVFMFRNYFMSMSHELFEAAKLDGCSTFRIYWNIYLPLALPVVGTIGVMNFIGSWNGITWPMIILRDETRFTLPLAVMFLDQSAFKQWNILMTGSLFSIIPVIVIFMCLQKSYIQGLSAGAVKG